MITEKRHLTKPLLKAVPKSPGSSLIDEKAIRRLRLGTSVTIILVKWSAIVGKIA